MTAGAPDPQFNRRLGFGTRPALIVVDLCRAYFDTESPLNLDRPEVLDACRTLIDAARDANAPVLWTRVEYEPGGSNGGIFYRKVGALSLFDRGGPFGDWVPGFEPHADDIVITKQQASGFHDTPLADELDGLGIDTAIVCGVSTSGCVRATALDACQYGFVPIVVTEACGDRDQTVHDGALFDLDAKYADVERLERVLEELGQI